MSIIKAFITISAKDGVAVALRKMLGVIIKKTKSFVKSIPLKKDLIKLNLLAFIKKRGQKMTVRVAGMRVQTTDARALLSEFREIFINHIYGFALSHDNENPVIIDGGGYIGISALYFKKHYPQAHIMVFEPNRHVLPLLKKNLAMNNAGDITIIEAGISNMDGELRFSGGDDSGMIDSTGDMTIIVKKLSRYVTGQVDFLKLNIEGAECDVIIELEKAGALTNINKLCIEWHSFARHSQNLGALLSTLEKNGFRYFINDFNKRINPSLQTPFNVNDNSEYFLLIYAQKTDYPA